MVTSNLVDENGLKPHEWIMAVVMANRGKQIKGRDGTMRKSNGTHVVFTGFNEAFKLAFDGEESRDYVDAMVEAGKLAKVPSFKGVTLYLPNEAPDRTDGPSSKATGLLADIKAMAANATARANVPTSNGNRSNRR